MSPVLALALILVGCIPQGEDSGVPTGTPYNGTLSAGTFGSPDLGLDVGARDVGQLRRSCWAGDLGTPVVQDGSLHVEFDWVRNGGAPPDSGGWEHDPAVLDATVTTEAIDGTLTSDWSPDPQAIHLVLGEETTYFECP